MGGDLLRNTIALDSRHDVFPRLALEPKQRVMPLTFHDRSLGEVSQQKKRTEESSQGKRPVIFMFLILL
jgi:hypothetical protein